MLVKRNHMLFPSLVNEFFKPDWFGGIENPRTGIPAVNIKDNEKDFEIELSVPGRAKEDFNLEVDNHVLTISYEVRKEGERKEENYTRKEFVQSAFKRSFELPESINVDAIDAKYEAGILSLVLPKKEEALPKPKRLISLS